MRKSRRLAAFALVALVLFPSMESQMSAQPTGDCRAVTVQGGVQGTRRSGACTYLGIPYAAPPVGNLRWRPPQPRAPWAPATYVADVLRQCPQVNANTGTLQGNDDCLFLNIWTPADVPAGRRLPVLVWLHAGAFQAASANFPAADGARFAAERNAIVVAPNYRLGPLGFLYHATLAAEDASYPTSGNYGLADQRAALRWVQANIAAFGGDPALVTLAGTSAGAESTSLHLVSPASRGLFQRAILQSGTSSMRWFSAADAEAQGERLAQGIGCTVPGTLPACLRAATLEQIMRALPIGQSQIREGNRADWRPVVDGVEIPQQPREMLRRGRFARVPIVLGVNGDEGWGFVGRSFPGDLTNLQYENAVRSEFGMDAEAILRTYAAPLYPTAKDALARIVGDVEYVCEARRVAQAAYREGAPVYVYVFVRGLTGLAGGRAVHGLESNFLFGNDFAVSPNLGITVPRPLTAADVAMYDAMSRYWRRFMEAGDPNPAGTPIQWPRYVPAVFTRLDDPAMQDAYFEFGEHLKVLHYLRDTQCNFWEPFNFRSVLGIVPAARR